MHCIFVR